MAVNNIQENIRKLADYNGIDVLGFAPASEYKKYLIKSNRRDPKRSLYKAKTIIIVGVYIGGIVLPSWEKSSHGRTSRLFLSGFFSNVIRQIEPIYKLLKKEGYNALICDDSKIGGSVIPLKLAAIKANLGWQGKNSLFISRQYGTYLALGGLITNAELNHDNTTETDHCGICNKCQEACPLSALENPYVLDRNRCLSSILQGKVISDEARTVLENRIIDCEICQQVCPWNAQHNKQALKTKMTLSFKKIIPEWEEYFKLSNLIRLSENKYKDTLGFLNTNIPYSTFYRNIFMAMERFHNRNSVS